MKKIFILSLCFTLLLSCAPSTTVVVKSNKIVDTEKRYRSVVIAVQGADDELQKEWEKNISTILTGTCDMSAIEFSQLAQKIRVKKGKTVLKELEKLGYDGVIVTETSSYDESFHEGEIPITIPKFERSYATISGTYNGRPFSGRANVLNTYSETTYVPYSYTKYQLTQSAWLLDTKTAETVWFAHIDAKGSNIRDLRTAMLRKTLIDLYKAKIVGSDSCSDNLNKILAISKKH